ncbi:hypothetical protein P280DRAFT_452821 [Massarina eburnea CBS 473.64]|uniref:DNA replication regulator SLD2 n=1 Tax=Massarina eburnea CBS 473.64 TaxID=1395130 RepID=A0A6A6RYR3_9PLEO|nr:hypothetical protein P280DRAFT_452821 [Massarina eburnea CBS 473.64]
MSNPEIEQRCNALRTDLKSWEVKFEKTHDGRKPAREDIKVDDTIAQKYKEYNKLRTILSGKHDPRTPAHDADRSREAAKAEESRSLKRKCEANAPQTSAEKKTKRAETEAHVTTPRKKDSPVQSQSPSPAFIGPTPQRDGKALGLFDHLPEATPSKSRTVFGSIDANILRTPSKTPAKTNTIATPETTRKWARTPMSSAKKFMLSQWVSPPKTEQDTPTSSPTYPQTPAFLRRGAYLAPIDEDHEPTPRIAPWKRATLFNRLSVVQVIQARKKAEEERFDEDADIMRELEMDEMEAMGVSTAKKQTFQERLSVAVEDSQPAMPLGVDRHPESDEEGDAEEVPGPDGKPMKIWKKRGLKRQTRRVNMKPHFPKPEPLPTQIYEDEPDSAVPETQINTGSNVGEVDFSSDDDSEYASDASHSQKKAKAQNKKAASSPSQMGKENKDVLKQTKDGAVKKAARKIKATAHANYQKLKIKSKGGNGGKGRFGYCVTSSPVRSWPMNLTKHQSVAYQQPRRSSQLPPPQYSTPTTTTATKALDPEFESTPPTATRLLSSTTTSRPTAMAEKELQDLLKQLQQTLQSHKYPQAQTLLSRAKVALLHLNALIPAENTPRKALLLARETLEIGAIVSIRLKDPVTFTRYFQQLQPFYSLPDLQKDGGNASKITGLYLLLLLSDGDYAGFHTLLETLEVAAAQTGKGLEEDQFIQYPIRLERALMEGSYDRVWGETKSERVPSEEFGLFSEVLIGTIRKEIASCSEKAYPSIPIADAKSLLFLESEGAVVIFAKELGWVVKDSRIYFPAQDDEYSSKDILVTSGQVIENALGYARELETIV